VWVGSKAGAILVKSDSENRLAGSVVRQQDGALPGGEAGAEVQQPANVLGGAHFRSELKITGNGWCMGDQAEAGDGPLENGNGEASGQGQQQKRDKGKVKVRDSWCAGWLAKAKARRRKKEEKEEKAKEVMHRRRAIAEAAEADLRRRNN
jgi:hypothetical protein